MISYEEAYKKAKELKPNANFCEEYENGFVFGSSEDKGFIGGKGHTRCVILKENGKPMTFPDFVSYGTGEYIKDFDI